MSVAATVLAIAQVVSVGKELVDLFTEGRITEEELVQRWHAVHERLPVLAAEWRARQERRRNDSDSA